MPLVQAGTYKIAVVNNMVAAVYEDGGEAKRWRGSAEAFAREVPAGAKNLQVSKTHSRTEVFVTSGKPTDKALQPTGLGLELVPITHPNDLVQGEAASFRLLRDGKPAVDVAIAVVPGGIRYRDNLKEMAVSTDKDGAAPGLAGRGIRGGGSDRRAPRPVGRDIGRLPALLRRRRPVLLAHHRPAHRLPRRPRAGVGDGAPSRVHDRRRAGHRAHGARR